MAVKWTCDTTIKFIKEYKSHECLWDTNSPDYLNTELRANAYQTLALQMNIPGFNVPEVKNKIRNLRSTFLQEKKKICRSKLRNEDPVYTPTLKWLDEMEPILRGVEPRKIRINNRISDTVLPETVSSINCSPSVSDDERRPVKKSRDGYISNLDNAINQLLSEPLDDEQIYGQYVASEVRQLKRTANKRKLKRMINEAIAAVAEADDLENEASQNFDNSRHGD